MAAKTTYKLELLLGAKTSTSYMRNIRSASKSLSGISNTAKIAAAGITTAFAAINISEKIQDITDTYAGFEQQLANSAAIANATSSEYEKLSNTARLAGRDTIYTAEDSAAALGYMALAGWDVNTSTKALMPTLRLASATGADLKTTSDLVTDSMSALGKGVDELQSYIDMLIEGNNDANTTAEQLMEALVKAGGASRTLGADLDDTITSLGILANNGEKGAEAGTALNAIFVRLAGNTSAIKELSKLKVNIWDDKGQFIGFREALIEINNALSKLTDEQKALSLKNVAGVNYYSEMSYLLDAVSESVNGEASAWDNLEAKLNNSQGALDRMYGKTTDTLKFAQQRWESAQDVSKIDLAEAFSDEYKDTLNWMADKLPEITDAVIDFADAHEKDIAKAFDKVEDVMETTWDVIQTGGTWIVKNKGPVISAVKGIGAALGTSFAVGKVSSLITLLTEFSNPAMAVGTGLTVAVGGIVALSTAIEEAHDAAVRANLDEHLGTISLSLEQLDKMARQVVGEDSLQGVSTFLNALSDAENTFENITDSWDSIQKSDWQIKAGFIFDEDDSQKYQSAIEDYISNVEKYAVDKGYEVHLAVSLLLENDTAELNSVNDFYSQIEEKLSKYGSELSEYVTNAMLDGFIDVDEDKIVQEYISKMNSITQAITDAENQAKFDSITLKYNATDLDADSLAALQADIGKYTEEIADGAQKAYESAMTMYHAKLELDDTYTQADFDKDSQKAWEAYYKMQSEATLQGADYMLNAINEAYPELQQGLDKYTSDLTNIIEKYAAEYSDIELEPDWQINPDLVINNMFDSMDKEALSALRNAMDSTDRDALKQLLDQMLPTVQQLAPVVQAYNEASEPLPEDLESFMKNWQLIYDLVGNQEGQERIDLANMLNTNEMFQNFLDDVGYEVDETHMKLQQKLDETYENGFDVKTELRINFDTKLKGLTNGVKNNPTLLDKIPSNAKGGIYDRPLLTTFAEEGPEAAIPLDGSQRAKNLLLEAASRLGMLSTGRVKRAADSFSNGTETTSNSSNIVVTYSPQITIQGNADKQVIQQANTITLQQLKTMIEAIEHDKKRTSYN